MAIFKNISTKSLAQANPLFNPTPYLYFDTSTYDNRENLLLESPFFNTWSLNSGATVVSNYDYAPNGNLEATLLTHSQTKQINGNLVVVPAAGEYYTFSCYYKNTGSSQTYHQLNCGGTGGTVAAVDINWTLETVTTRFGTPISAGIINVGNGWYRVWIVGLVGTGGSGATPYIVSASTPDNTVLVWGPQMERGQQPSAYINTNNLLFSSESFNTTWGGGSVTISVDQIAAPNNTLTADAIIETTATTAYHYVNQAYTKSAISEPYTFSCYVKNKSNNRDIELIVQDGANGVVARFNPLAGTISFAAGAYGTGYTAVTSGITSVGNGWFRAWVTVITNTSTTVQGQLTLNTGAGNTYTGDGTSGVYIWGAQLERGVYMSQYTATTSTIKYYPRPTYISDIGSSTNTGTLVGNLYPDSTGVFTFNGTSNYIYTRTNYPSVNGYEFTLTGMFKTTVASGKKIVGFQVDQTGENLLGWDKNVYIDTSGKLVWGVYNGGTQVVTSSVTVTDGAWHHFAATHSYANTRIELFLDGVSQGVVNARSNDGGTYLRIGSWTQSGWPGGANGYWSGSLSHIGFYPGIFTAEQARSHMYAIRSKENIVKDQLALNVDANKTVSYGQLLSKNRLPYPENFNISLWAPYCGNNSNITYNTIEVPAPDGTYTATKIVRNNITICAASTGWGFFWQASNIFSVGKTYTVSVYARLASGPVTSFWLGLNDYHTLNIGTITTSWQRYTVTRTIGSTSALELDRGIQFYITDQNCSFYFWGAQMEPGSTATTYYPQSLGYNASPVTTWQDMTGSGNGGALLRSTYFETNPSRFEVDISTNTSNNGLNITNPITLADGTAYSLSFWVKNSTLTLNFWHSLLGRNSYDCWVGINHADTTGSNWYLFFRQEGGTYVNFSQITNYNISTTWTNIVLTIDTSRVVRFYLNGAYKEKGTAASTNLGAVARLASGYDNGTQYYALQGALGSAFIHTKTLSALEVKQNFDAQRWRFGV